MLPDNDIEINVVVGKALQFPEVGIVNVVID